VIDITAAPPAGAGRRRNSPRARNPDFTSSRARLPSRLDFDVDPTRPSVWDTNRNADPPPEPTLRGRPAHPHPPHTTSPSRAISIWPRPPLFWPRAPPRPLRDRAPAPPGPPPRDPRARSIQRTGPGINRAGPPRAPPLAVFRGFSWPFPIFVARSRRRGVSSGRSARAQFRPSRASSPRGPGPRTPAHGPQSSAREPRRPAAPAGGPAPPAGGTAAQSKPGPDSRKGRIRAPPRRRRTCARVVTGGFWCLPC
jgi:hypothetical protein